MTAGIYKIISKIDGRYYLGSSKNIEKRWIIHKSHLNNKKHINIFLQRAWEKYGCENFELSIIENCDGYSRDDIFNLEQFYLDKIDDISYNLSKKAKGGDNLTYHPNRKEIINSISESQIERYKNMSQEEWDIFCNSQVGEKNGMFGRSHTEESKILISENIKKFYENNDHFLKNKTFEEYFGEEEAKRRKQIISENASKRTGEKNPFYGKKHSAESIEKIRKRKLEIYLGDQNKPIMIDNIYYSSVGVASKILNIPATTIRWRILSKNKKFDNYKYAESNL